ncbi:MAG: hypothetical protein M1834_001601 [Cirrosporium novae-zelandiae]|nr:MAG: hypothetical protein M1834_004118 [Cirrosporium novae-zelandiae]KAI9735585.1 MAG: hypothetical protein M1834_001601 [Cirrosporium novae-zelandiae]
MACTSFMKSTASCSRPDRNKAIPNFHEIIKETNKLRYDHVDLSAVDLHCSHNLAFIKSRDHEDSDTHNTSHPERFSPVKIIFYPATTKSNINRIKESGIKSNLASTDDNPRHLQGTSSAIPTKPQASPVGTDAVDIHSGDDDSFSQYFLDLEEDILNYLENVMGIEAKILQRYPAGTETFERDTGQQYPWTLLEDISFKCMENLRKVRDEVPCFNIPKIQKPDQESESYWKIPIARLEGFDTYRIENLASIQDSVLKVHVAVMGELLQRRGNQGAATISLKNVNIDCIQSHTLKEDKILQSHVTIRKELSQRNKNHSTAPFTRVENDNTERLESLAQVQDKALQSHLNTVRGLDQRNEKNYTIFSTRLRSNNIERLHDVIFIRHEQIRGFSSEKVDTQSSYQKNDERYKELREESMSPIKVASLQSRRAKQSLATIQTTNDKNKIFPPSLDDGSMLDSSICLSESDSTSKSTDENLSADNDLYLNIGILHEFDLEEDDCLESSFLPSNPHTSIPPPPSKKCTSTKLHSNTTSTEEVESSPDIQPPPPSSSPRTTSIFPSHRETSLDTSTTSTTTSSSIQQNENISEIFPQHLQPVIIIICNPFKPKDLLVSLNSNTEKPKGPPCQSRLQTESSSSDNSNPTPLSTHNSKVRAPLKLPIVSPPTKIRPPPEANKHKYSPNPKLNPRYETLDAIMARIETLSQKLRSDSLPTAKEYQLPSANSPSPSKRKSPSTCLEDTTLVPSSPPSPPSPLTSLTSPPTSPKRTFSPPSTPPISLTPTKTTTTHTKYIPGSNSYPNPTPWFYEILFLFPFFIIFLRDMLSTAV